MPDRVSKGKYKTAREILEDLTKRINESANKHDGMSLSNVRAIGRAKSELALWVRSKAYDVKLCGKGYDSCSKCPYVDEECDHKKHFNQAFELIAKSMEEEA